MRHVAFLSERPAAPAIARLDPDRSPGDRFTLVGREIYFLFPNGVGRTKLTADYLDRTLGVTSTYRNWRTVEKLTELAARTYDLTRSYARQSKSRAAQPPSSGLEAVFLDTIGHGIQGASWQTEGCAA